ncbi:MAG: SDR family oxidoreductase [Dehalococcoidia bacterium]|jgi:NAD(P)-dependent dehydrogenase (short-subunit alcohol dehydrogenase family)|nr:SDR family oxidoreductase [Dehalococcoidia bacterium]MDP6783528.1 SDR family oxidoreductase [Dehalococcoidia bacterium]
MRFPNKVVLVSGGGSIGPSMSNGRASAIKFAREGAKVVVVDRKMESAAETVEMIKKEGWEAVALEANVLRDADVQRMVEAVMSAHGRIDVLFNNVGGGWGSDVVNTPEEPWDRTFDLCVKSIFLVSKYVVPQMRKTGGGVIINNASVAAYIHDTLWAYNAAKAAVIKLTQDMAYDYGCENIRVNCVVPGLIDSALGRLRVAGDEKADAERQSIVRESVPLGRSGTPEEIANAVLFLASDEASYCNGTCLMVDGGLTCR